MNATCHASRRGRLPGETRRAEVRRRVFFVGRSGEEVFLVSTRAGRAGLTSAMAHILDRPWGQKLARTPFTLVSDR